MYGGSGNDRYVVDDEDDRVVESTNGGIDTVYSYIRSYRLGNHQENVTFSRR